MTSVKKLTMDFMLISPLKPPSCLIRSFLPIPHSAIRIRHLIKSCPGQGPVSESLVDSIHRLEQVIFLVLPFKKIQLAPFFFQYGNPYSQEPNWFGMGNRFKDI